MAKMFNLINIKIFKNRENIFFLQLLIFTIPLLVYKDIYKFRESQLFILKLFTTILFFIWVKNKIKNKQFLISIEKNIFLAILFFVLVLNLSLFKNKNLWIAIDDYFIFLSYCTLLIIILDSIINKKDIFKIYYLVFIVSFLLSFYTILHYYGVDPYLNEYNFVVSTIGQKNWISNYISMSFLLLFCFFIQETKKNIKIAFFLIIVILYITLMISQSRSCWISLISTLFIGIFCVYNFNLKYIFYKNKKWLIFLLITFIIVTWIFSTDNFINQNNTNVYRRTVSTFDEEDHSINARVLIWKTSLNMIKDKPFFGHGIGYFKKKYLDYQARFLSDNQEYVKYYINAKEAHNEYIQIAVELGIIGLLIFLFFLYKIALLFIKYLKDEKDSRDRIIILGSLMSFIFFLIHSLFIFPLHVPALGTTFFIILALSISYIKTKDCNNQFLKNEQFPKNNLLADNGINFKNVKNYKNITSFIISLICFAILIIFSANYIFKPFIAEYYYGKGLKAEFNSEYKVALEFYEKAYSYDQFDGKILHSLGSTYYNFGNYMDGEKLLTESKLYSTNLNTYYNLGLLYIETNLYKKAEREFQKVVFLKPDSFRGHLNLAYVYAKQDNFDKAIYEWNKTLGIEPNFSEKYNILYYLGLTYEKKQMPEKALEYFIQALQLVPEGSPIIEEIEEEIYNIYKGKLDS